MEIGERLMRLRQSSNQSLQQVADAVGVSKAHVWELEKGRSRNPSFELVRKLASHYGVSIDVLTGTAPEPAPEDIKVGRMHRDLESLSKRDRAIVEELIASMKARSSEGS
ncbi:MULTISPECIES: helix-turn-helix domain-containing protein [Maritimibacter]|uniref:HTH cro/C1-type domain-containing protein n=1 Tax=Maritimibacter alkaliphilus HTCC2654 TaxID=314271 RepID=A3VDJ0_9RHOB|nr:MULTISPECIES: helix-turn-helix transcriptional regulator [Maritimibacter]EAQ13579.1 hypothetical protein RB2654_02659 [Maritimibacter alkaliphilus HTCC2654]MBL6428927.1 helix-turn-helix transcriptional regulator [Maritimibacter sp.]TYP83420.1 helix-turn-helix protein [Maritimibacter alkaliphilus HTCC2654]